MDDMNIQLDKAAASNIAAEGKMTEDAKIARELLMEREQWEIRAQDFIKKCNAPPQEPTNFLRNVLMTFAIKKLDSKIITLGD